MCFIDFDHQLQRIEQLTNRLKAIQEDAFQKLVTKPAPKKWSVVEVILHMTQAHMFYEPKLKRLMETLPKSQQPVSTIKPSWLTNFLVNGFRPKEGKVRFKMKTFGPFQPQLSNLTEQEVEKAFNDFYSQLEVSKTAIAACRGLDVKRKKVNSALGPLVRFNLAEAIEFMLAHDERHLFQIERVLEQVKG